MNNQKVHYAQSGRGPEINKEFSPSIPEKIEEDKQKTDNSTLVKKTGVLNEIEETTDFVDSDNPADYKNTKAEEIKIIENKKEIFKCEICGLEANAKIGLISHMRKHKSEVGENK